MKKRLLIIILMGGSLIAIIGLILTMVIKNEKSYDNQIKRFRDSEHMSYTLVYQGFNPTTLKHLVAKDSVHILEDEEYHELGFVYNLKDQEIFKEVKVYKRTSASPSTSLLSHNMTWATLDHDKALFDRNLINQVKGILQQYEPVTTEDGFTSINRYRVSDEDYIDVYYDHQLDSLTWIDLSHSTLLGPSEYDNDGLYQMVASDSDSIEVGLGTRYLTDIRFGKESLDTFKEAYRTYDHDGTTPLYDKVPYSFFEAEASRLGYDDYGVISTGPTAYKVIYYWMNHFDQVLEIEYGMDLEVVEEREVLIDAFSGYEVYAPFGYDWQKDSIIVFKYQVNGEEISGEFVAIQVPKYKKSNGLIRLPNYRKEATILPQGVASSLMAAGDWVWYINQLEEMTIINMASGQRYSFLIDETYLQAMKEKKYEIVMEENNGVLSILRLTENGYEFQYDPRELIFFTWKKQ